MPEILRISRTILSPSKWAEYDGFQLFFQNSDIAFPLDNGGPDPRIIDAMNDPEPCHVACIRREIMSGKFLAKGPCIVLLIRGFAHCRLQAPDGTVYFNYDGHTPCLYLVAPGMTIVFETTRNRENGYIELFSNLVRRGRTGYVEIQEMQDWFEVPCSLPLSPCQASSLWDEFEALQAAWSVPIPRNLFRVKAGIVALLRLFIEQRESVPTDALTPAQILRRLIDEDRHLTRNLEELSRECGYSSDHMRKLFRARYHLSPQDYRHRQRMARARALMVSTQLTLPEIAQATGFDHVTHFCSAFKKAFHLTPLQGLKRFRREITPTPETGLQGRTR